MTYYFTWSSSLLANNGLNLLLLFIWCWIQLFWRMECSRKRKFFVFFYFFKLAHFSKETGLLLQASNEQADSESRPQVSREVLPIHCQAWTCPSIVMLNYTSPAKRFLPKIVNEKKYLPTQLLTFILTKKQSDYSMVF